MKLDAKCPNCGSRGPHLDNDGRGLDLTLLCTNLVDPDRWASSEPAEDFPEVWVDGKVPCGMQWEPASLCPDCGEPDERAGHMGCQYPQDRDEPEHLDPVPAP